uniref:Uncharacterized protein n=1 Tax=Arundo donax TaxID=35708 RepID=A0A0A9BCQ8_ARUDO
MTNDHEKPRMFNLFFHENNVGYQFQFQLHKLW